MSSHSQSNASVRRHLAHEVAELKAAIVMVGSGAAPRVTLAGLSHGEALLAATSAFADTSGVVIEPIWGWEEDGCDITVTRKPAATNG